MFCPNCGSQVDDDAKFCTVCGAVLPKLDNPQRQQTVNGTETAQQATEESKAPFGDAYENPPQTPNNTVVDNSPFGAAYETPQSMRQYNQQPYNNPYNGGTQYPPYQPQNTQTPPATDNNVVALVGFILSFFVPIAGLICSIIGLKNSRINGKRRGFAIAGIIISAVTMFFNFIFMVVFGVDAYLSTIFGFLYR